MDENNDYRNVERVPDLVGRLYEIVSELEALFPGRHFTPDGHLVGSLGEVMAAHDYGLVLLPASAERHDARTQDGRLVQIKATQGSRVSLRSQPDHLIVLRLTKHGSALEVYNGPGKLAWNEAGRMQRNGQCPISLAKLRALMEEMPLRGADLRGADLSGANLKDARYNAKTTWPEGFSPQPAGAVAG